MTTFPAWWPTENNESQEPAQTGLWSGLQNVLDIKQTKPMQAADIFSKEMTDASGRHFMLKNARAHTYARLSPEEFWLWQQMNGEKTVQQIVLAYFMEFKSFAFGAVVGLIGRLSDQHMLSEAPRSIYGDAARALQEQKLSYKLTWLARLAFTKEWTIKGLDSHLERIYRYGGWILFTVPIQIALLLVSVIGTFLFISVSQQPQYDLFGKDFGTIMITLGLISYIPIVIHEFAHAITAKHFGCEVYKGGAMLYYGMPAAFVDTTDVWMYGKRARLSVTWAGPYTGYIIAGICTLLVRFVPTMPINIAIFLLQISLVGIFLSTSNLLPILKLDGYYMLADALEIPRLRERSMEFISKGLRAKISKREKWTREEWIFLVFGALAFLSSFYFTYAALHYWDSKTTSSISTLLKFSGDLIAQITNVGTVLLALSSISYSLYLLASNGPLVVQWLRKIGLLSTRGRSALVMLFGAAALTMIPQFVLPTLANWLILGVGVLSFGFAAWLAFTNYRKMRGSIHAGMWLFATLGFIAGAGSVLGAVNAQWTEATIGLHEAGIFLSCLIFLFAGRLLIGLRGSWRFMSIGLIALGIIAWAVSLFTSAVLAQTFAGLLILGGLLHWNMRPIILENQSEKEKRAESTRKQLMDAFIHIKLTVSRELENDFGQKTKNWVENGYYRSARSWFGGAKKIDESQFASTQTGMTPSDYGVSMALALEEMLIGVEKAAGKSYAVRALAYGIDSLNWEMQEIAEDYILKYVHHAAGLSQKLTDPRGDIETLVRSVPFFANKTDREIALLCKQFKPKRFARRDVIIKEGDFGDEFFLIRTGRVEVTSRIDPNKKGYSGVDAKSALRKRDHAIMISFKEHTLAHLTRSDHFGEMALLSDEKRNATVRALTPVEVLCLNRKSYNRLLKKSFTQEANDSAAMKRMGILRQIPLFSEFDAMQLSLLETKLEKIEVKANETIFKYGDEGNYFYVIKSGRVSVQFPVKDEKGEVTFVERAALGTGEHFGEVALMMDMMRTASIIATKPTTLLRLDQKSFAELLNQSQEIKQAMERASSRRVLANRSWLERDAVG